MLIYEIKEEIIYPDWFKNEKIHYSHQARLIQKDEDYKEKFPDLPKEYLKYGYIWPSKWTSGELEILPISKLAEKFKEVIICCALKKNGEKCKNKARKKSDKCGVHNK